MGTDRIYYLNDSWRIPMFVLDVVAFVFSVGLSVLAYMQQGKIDLGHLGFDLFFALLGLELIDERLRSRIEITEVGILYCQPRFTLNCRWSDLAGVLIAKSGTALQFSQSEVVSGGLALMMLKLLGPWHQIIPLTPYVTPENKGQIRKVILPYLNLKKMRKTDQEFLLRLLSENT